LAVIANVGQTNPYILAFGLPAEAAPLLRMPWLTAGLAVGVVALVGQAWMAGYWSAAWRAHYALVALAALGFHVLLALARLWPVG
jgi:hypothetical protein